jgi:hypothetical protein
MRPDRSQSSAHVIEFHFHNLRIAVPATPRHFYLQLSLARRRLWSHEHLHVGPRRLSEHSGRSQQHADRPAAFGRQTQPAKVVCPQSFPPEPHRPCRPTPQRLIGRPQFVGLRFRMDHD